MERPNMMTTNDTKLILKQRDYLRDLLAEFGVTLSGWDPGVTGMLPDNRRGKGYFGESLHFDGHEWAWLEPLLVELRDRRKTAPDFIRFASKKPAKKKLID